MKKVLIIGFVERARYGGGFRQEPLAKYLPEFGWQPIVLTPPLLGKRGFPFRVIETPYHDVLSSWRRLLKLKPDDSIRRQVRQRLGVTSRRSFIDFLASTFGAVVCYPDEHKGWKTFALKTGNELFQQEKIDAMISCMPVTSYIVARELKDRYKIPWIADFADLWSQNDTYRYGPLRKCLDARLELKTLSSTDVIVTVTPPDADKMKALHKGKPVYAITNGFDPAEVNTPPASLTDRFTITYTGSVRTLRHDPSKFFIALRDLLSKGVIEPSEVEVRFYGPDDGWLRREIEQYGLSSVCNLYGMVPNEVALKKQRESHLLLFLKWEDPQFQGSYSGKIFEYLAAKRPILATGGYTDVITKLLNETKAGIEAPTTQDIEDTLAKLYQEYKSKGMIAYTGINSEIDKYSHREMARRFAEILNHLVA